MTKAEYLIDQGYIAKDPFDRQSFYKNYNDQIELNIHIGFLSYRIIPKYRDIISHEVIYLEDEALSAVEHDFGWMLEYEN